MKHFARRIFGPHPGLTVAAAVLIALAAMPIVAIIVIATDPSGDGTIDHLVATVLPGAAATTALLMLGVGLMTTFIGVATAWLVSTCVFPGRRLLEIALVLPLAIPLYISAFAYIEFLDFTGPLQTFIRALGGYTSARDYWFPDVRSLPGAIIIMSLGLYPYVFLTTRIVFLMQSASALNVSRTLGRTALGAFFSVALPLARRPSSPG